MPTLDLTPPSTADWGYAKSGSSEFVLASAENGSVYHGEFPSHHSWYRYANVTIPQGATIDVAHLVLKNPSVAQAGTHTITITAVDEDDHAAPITFADWNTDHGIHTTASASWNYTVTATGPLQTVSIVSVLQEIVDRVGWVSGNDIGIHLDYTSGSGLQRHGSGGAGNEPVLHIEYTSGEAHQRTISSVAVSTLVDA